MIVMTKEELLKELEKLPKIETNNQISAMNSINVDDLMSAVDRLNKIPDYNDLLKENAELKKQIEVSNELVAQGTLTEMKLRNEVNRWRKEYQDTYKDVRIEIKEYKTQQKEFIKYLEDGIKQYTPSLRWKHYNEDGFNDYDVENPSCIEVQPTDKIFKEILQKYKEIIGE